MLGLGRPAGQLSMVAETVYEEVAFGPANLGLPRAEVMARVDDALEQVAIGHLASRDPRRLSGGEQQLVAMAGLLAMRAPHLVLDEPVAHLDARGRELVLSAITAAAAAGTAVLVATRSSDVVSRCCSSVLVMAGGRVVAQGPAAPRSWPTRRHGRWASRSRPRHASRRLLAEAGLDRDPPRVVTAPRPG